MILPNFEFVVLKEDDASKTRIFFSMWELSCLFTSCLQIIVCFLMQYFQNISAKNITYSNFLGILNKIPCLSICLLFLDFCGTTTTTNCSILCKYSFRSYFLFFWLLLPKICFPCTYCTNSALCHRSWLCMSLLWTSKGLFVLYVAIVNWIIWHFPPHDCNINLKFEFNFQ